MRSETLLEEFTWPDKVLVSTGADADDGWLRSEILLEEFTWPDEAMVLTGADADDGWLREVVNVLFGVSDG